MTGVEHRDAIAQVERFFLLVRDEHRGDPHAVLNAGHLEQTGSPEELYEHPSSLFVASFVGRANVFRGAAARALGLTRPDYVLVVRPERLRFGDAGLPGVVRERRYTGAAAFFQIEGDDGQRFEVLAEPDGAQVGARVYVDATRVIALPDEAGRR